MPFHQVLQGVWSPSAQPPQGINKPSMLMDLEVHVRSRCPSGITHECNPLSPPHPLTLPHDIALVMGVEGIQAVSMVNHHNIAIAIRPTPAEHYHSFIHRDNR
jgi:hypothetical protein